MLNIGQNNNTPPQPISSGRRLGRGIWTSSFLEPDDNQVSTVHTCFFLKLYFSNFCYFVLADDLGEEEDSQTDDEEFVGEDSDENEDDADGKEEGKRRPKNLDNEIAGLAEETAEKATAI